MTSEVAAKRDPALLGTVALVAVTAVWGSTFIVVKDAVEQMPVLDFLVWRFAIATALMVLIHPKAVAGLSARSRRRGLVLGLVLGVGYILQTVGLQYTSASVSGFITGMFVVFTPIVAWVLFRQRIEPAVWIAVILATVGLALLSLKGFALGQGEALTLASAAMYATHIVLLGEWARSDEAYGLAVVQLGTVSVMCLIPTLPGGLESPGDASVWGAVIFMAVAATAVAFVAQTWAQAHIPASRAAVIMTLEPVFAAVIAVLVGGESLGLRTVAGGALVLAAMYVVEMGPRHFKDATVGRLEA